MFLLVAGCGGGSGGNVKPVYGLDAPGSNVSPCALLTAAQLTSAVSGSKYDAGQAGTSQGGVPLCTFKDEAQGGFINVLVQDFSDKERWLQDAQRGESYQGQPENGPWDDGLAVGLQHGVEVAFLIRRVGVSVLAVPGASQEGSQEDLPSQLGVVAREAASHFSRKDGGGPNPTPSLGEPSPSDPPQMSNPYDGGGG